MNDLEIQRIVDGECDHDSRARLLSSLGDDAEQWRTLALRLLEDQAMRNLFRADLTTNSTTSLASAHACAPRGNQVTRHRWMLAASLVFMAIGLSSFYRSKRLLAETAAHAASKTQSPVLVAQGSAVISHVPTQAAPVGRMRMRVGDNADSTFEVPVYEVSEIKPETLIGDGVKQIVDLNSHLNRRGWTADLDTKIYEGQLEDGSRMMVPINFVQFQPIGY